MFYAGHGIEMDGVNYLVPVDARLERDVDVRFETLTVDDLLVSTSGAALRLVILDACRNNPLARSMQRTAAFRSVSGGSFARLERGSAGGRDAGSVCGGGGDDGGRRARNGTARTRRRCCRIWRRRWRSGCCSAACVRQVLASTNGAQRPHEYASLLGQHYLATPAPGPVVSAAGEPTEALVQR